MVEEFLVRGGFPELYADPEIDAEGYLRSYVATYLERDLRQLLQVATPAGLRALPARGGAPVGPVAQPRRPWRGTRGVAGSTAGAWLSALDASHQIMLLEPWFANRTKGLVKRPKLYVRDAGLAAFLCGVHTARGSEPSPRWPAPSGRRSSAPRSAAAR